MAPIVVLDLLAITTTVIITTTNNNHSVTNTSNGSVDSLSSFKAFQDTMVGSSDIVICTIIPPSISAKIITKQWLPFFSPYLSLFNSPSISLSNLTAMAAVYFHIHTGSVERETKRILKSIRDDFFHVDNLKDIGFLNSADKLTLIFNLTHRTVNVTCFTFHSAANTSQLTSCLPPRSSRSNFR